MGGEERRKSVRFPHRVKVKLFLEHGNVTVEALDFSEIGMYLIYNGDLTPLINSLIKLQLQEHKDAQIINVRVIRVEPGKGFAVEFQETAV